MAVHCAHLGWTKARLYQWSTKDWSGDGRWHRHARLKWSGGWALLLMAVLGSDTRAAGQAEPGYGTVVETTAQGLADAGPAGAAVLVRGTATDGGRDLGSDTTHG